jgi:hypothetical protein
MGSTCTRRPGCGGRSSCAQPPIHAPGEPERSGARMAQPVLDGHQPALIGDRPNVGAVSGVRDGDPRLARRVCPVERLVQRPLAVYEEVTTWS